jgi:DNA-directed RNA polymerase II subunit RPB3
MPASCCTFQFEPKIQINESLMSNLTDSKKDSFVKSCPAKVFKFNEITRSVDIDNPLACMYCMECVKQSEEFEMRDLVSIGQHENRFHFYVEVRLLLDLDWILIWIGF